MPALLYQLIGTQQYGLRDGDSERFGCFQIDDQREFAWLLDRKGRWSCSAQDSIVAFLAASVAVVPEVTMSSALSRTSSFASRPRASVFPFACRRSTRRLCP